MRKHALKALGLSLLAALGLMALAATGAQAAGEIRVLGSAALATGLTFTGSQEGAGALEVPALNLEIACQEFDVLEGKIISGPLGEALIKLLFLKCVPWFVEKTGTHTYKLVEELTECQILDGATGTAGDITAIAYILVVLHPATGSKDTYLLVTPDVAGKEAEGVFATYKFTAGKGCPLPTPVEVRGGAIVFQVKTGDLSLGQAEVVEPLIEANGPIQLLLKDKFLYGANEAFIKSNAKLALTGTHLGCKWGAI